MENILLGFAIIVGVIVVASIINEKKLHMPHDIALLIFATLISIVLLICCKFGIFPEIIGIISNIKFDSFLLEFVLGFMIFAGASKTRINKFVKNIVPISLLAVVTTIVSTLIYGGIFYLISYLLGFNLNIWICLLLGIIISPTDPIAATGILSKLGLSKSIISVIEGESLLNDGFAVAIFVFIRGVIEKGIGENFLILIFKEIVGALVVGFVISYLLFKLFKMTNEPIMHILISLLTVSLSYVICEYFGFSGVIASVVCGMYYSYQISKISRWKEVVDSKDLYEDFWHIIETLLNSVLFVLVGFSIVYLEVSSYILILIPVAIILNLFARYFGVSISTLIMGKKKIPGKYNFKEFVMLLSWAGLKGGISLALVLSVKNILPNDAYVVLLNSTIITILFTTIAQGLSTSKVYNYIEKMREKRIEEIL